MPIRFQIAVLVLLMVNAIVFRVGIVTVLAIPGLAVHAGRLIPAVIVASFVVSAPLSWFIAPRLTERYSRRHSA